MSHETHHHHQPATEQTKTPFTSAFWFVIILAGLFIAAVNFINVMGADSGHGEGHGATESHQSNKEATHNQSLHGETGLGKPVEESTQHHGSNTGADTTHMEGH